MAYIPACCHAPRATRSRARRSRISRRTASGCGRSRCPEWRRSSASSVSTCRTSRRISRPASRSAGGWRPSTGATATRRRPRSRAPARRSTSSALDELVSFTVPQNVRSQRRHEADRNDARPGRRLRSSALPAGTPLSAATCCIARARALLITKIGVLWSGEAAGACPVRRARCAAGVCRCACARRLPTRAEVVVELTGPAGRRARAARRSCATPAGTSTSSAWARAWRWPQLAREQRAAVGRLQRAAPGLRVRGHLRTVMDALVVTVPRSELARLAARGAARVAGVTYRSQAVSVVQLAGRRPTACRPWSARPALWSGLDGGIAAAGDGMRIGDHRRRHRHDPALVLGRRLPLSAGLPQGPAESTNGKIIVARAFAPPGGSARMRTAFDPDGSEHGTHVAGIAAGLSGITGTSLGVTISGLSGVAPHAYLGSYRVLTTPTPVVRPRRQRPRDRARDRPGRRRRHGRAQPLARRAGGRVRQRPRRARHPRRRQGRRRDRRRGRQQRRRPRRRLGLLARLGARRDHRRGHERRALRRRHARRARARRGAGRPGRVRRRHRRARSDPRRAGRPACRWSSPELRRRPRAARSCSSSSARAAPPRTPTRRSPPASLGIVYAQRAAGDPTAVDDSQQRSLTVSDLIGARLAQQATAAGGELTLSVDNVPERAGLGQLRPDRILLVARPGAVLARAQARRLGARASTSSRRSRAATAPGRARAWPRPPWPARRRCCASATRAGRRRRSSRRWC